MVSPVVHRIVQGETLSFELRFVGEDLTDATPRIKTGSGVSEVDFSLSVILPDTVEVVAVSTHHFSPGTHDFRVWLDWGDGTSEVGLSGLFHVSPRLDFWDVGTGVLDGGKPSTEHEDAVDGGPV